MTDESPEITESEASNQEECKEVALRIFEDACVLYNEERYRGALYLSGYVIENGVKAELFRLGNIAQTPDQLLNYATNTLYEWLRFVTGNFFSEHREISMSSFLTQLEDRLKQPEKKILFHAFFFDTNKRGDKFTHIPAIYSMQSKRAPSTENDKHHNLDSFLKQLEYWRKQLAVNEHEIRPDDYKITGWKSSLRYSIPNSNYNMPEQERAKEALKRAYSFLKKVVYKRDSFLANETAIRVVHENFSQADEVNTITTSSGTNNRLE